MAEYKPRGASSPIEYKSRLNSWWDSQYGWPLVIAAALVGVMGFSLYFRQYRIAESRQQSQPIERKLEETLAGLDDTLNETTYALYETGSVTRELEDLLQQSRETVTELRKLADELSSAHVPGR